MKEAIVLMSGGLDSAVTLAVAKQDRYICHGLIFSTPNFSTHERNCVLSLVRKNQLKSFNTIKVEVNKSLGGNEPLRDMSPGRNLVFLAHAFAWAEILNIQNIFIGANADDQEGFTDCRIGFFNAIEKVMNLGSCLENPKYRIKTPLIALNKQIVIQLGLKLNVDFSQTLSCYEINEQGYSCGKCHSCEERLRGFKELGIIDPIKYVGDSNG